MTRVKGTCKGDCSTCELLAAGEVDMIPCVLDQIFRRTQRTEAELMQMKEKIENIQTTPFSGVEIEN